MHRAFALLAALAACGALAVAALAAGQKQRITVYAASSLTDAFPALAHGPRYSFAGSNTLATQITQGAPADVFASANTKIPAQLYKQGIVDEPVVFTRNTLVIAVPKSNPAGIRSIRDLTRHGVKVVVANASVPVGGYTLQVLRKLHLKAKVERNVVSEETNVREVLSKVALGQADAGLVYSTDAATVARRVTAIRLPARAQPDVTYAMAVVSASRHKAAARAFVKRVLSKHGQATLHRFGFLPRAGK